MLDKICILTVFYHNTVFSMWKYSHSLRAQRNISQKFWAFYQIANITEPLVGRCQAASKREDYWYESERNYLNSRICFFCCFSAVLLPFKICLYTINSNIIFSGKLISCVVYSILQKLYLLVLVWTLQNDILLLQLWQSWPNFWNLN